MTAWPETVRFLVDGEPIPQGSLRGFVRGGRAVLTGDNPRTKAWRSAIADAAADHVDGPLDEPLDVRLTFWMPRPPSAPKLRVWPTVKPDLDKLARAVLDALTGVVWTDDSRVVRLSAVKSYAPSGREGLAVEVRRAEP